MKQITALFTSLCCFLLPACSDQQRGVTEVRLQHFFGSCTPSQSQDNGECETILAIVNSFNQQHRDIQIIVNNVQWPGYTELAAQLATDSAPDIVSMHQSVIYDYSSRGLISPLDRGLAAVGVPLADFTSAASKGVIRGGKTFGLPFDNWMPLWHINTNLFRAAGLLSNGSPILPKSPEQLLNQARIFKKKTGKPYLIQSTVNEAYATARTFFTLVMQQNAPIFLSEHQIELRTEAARRALRLLKMMRAEGLSTANADYTAANADFVNGDGGVYIVGTWMIGTYDKLSAIKSSPLYRSYAVRPFPRLFEKEATYADGHAWVVPASRRTDRKMRAIFIVLRFLYDHDRDWARTGHVPAYQSVINNPTWRHTKHRSELASLAKTGMPLPAGVQRQFLIQDIVSQEVEAAVSGNKSIDDALVSADRRVNDLLFNLIN